MLPVPLTLLVLSRRRSGWGAGGGCEGAELNLLLRTVDVPTRSPSAAWSCPTAALWHLQGWRVWGAPGSAGCIGHPCLCPPGARTAPPPQQRLECLQTSAVFPVSTPPLAPDVDHRPRSIWDQIYKSLVLFFKATFSNLSNMFVHVWSSF